MHRLGVKRAGVCGKVSLSVRQPHRCYLPHHSTISPPVEEKPNLLLDKLKNKIKVAVIGGGNWGSAVARKVGFNVSQLASPTIDHQVKLWVYEEQYEGKPLTEIINTRRENVKYLPGVYIPQNVKAIPSLADVVRDSNVLLFVMPHSFLPAVLHQIKQIGLPSSTICASFIKGVQVSSGGELRRYSDIIKEELQVDHVAAVMGANVANDIAHDSFAETTVACVDAEVRQIVAGLFHSQNLRAQTTDDISTVELCGALKNVVALGAGICDGLELGSSTKAAVIRQGLEEMSLFCKVFDSTGRYKPDTLLLSCGVADVIATSYGGRNRLCSAEFTRRYLLHHDQRGGGDEEEGGGSEEGSGSGSEEAIRIVWEEIEKDMLHGQKIVWEEIEKDMLHGQKLEGVSACKEAIILLERSGYLKRNPSHFPLFRSIHRIAVFGESSEELFNWGYYQ
eukprot:gene11369-12392_t